MRFSGYFLNPLNESISLTELSKLFHNAIDEGIQLFGKVLVRVRGDIKSLALQRG